MYHCRISKFKISILLFLLSVRSKLTKMDHLNHCSRPKSVGPHQRQDAITKGVGGIKAKVQSRSELTSSIPKPIPFVRRSSCLTPRSTRRRINSIECANYGSAFPDNMSAPFSLPQEREATRESLDLNATSPQLPSEKQMQTLRRSLIPRRINRPQSAGVPQSRLQLSSNLIRPLSSTIVHPVLPVSHESNKIIAPLSSKLVPLSPPKLVIPTSINTSRSASPSSVKTVIESPNLVRPISPNVGHLASPTKLISSISRTPVRPSSSNVVRPLSPNIVRPALPKSRSMSPKQLSKLMNCTNTSITLKSSRTSLSTKATMDNDRPPTDGGRQLSRESMKTEQVKMAKEVTELSESTADQQALELQVQPTVLERPKNYSNEKTILFAGDSPEFLEKFDKQMEELTQLWLRFTCEVMSHKLMAGKSSLTRVIRPDPNKDPREELYMFLAQIPTEGSDLLDKLRTIEEGLLETKTGVMYKVMTLWKDFGDLKDEHWRLEKTQDQLHSELEDELEILTEENKTLEKKYTDAVDKYDREKNKCLAQEKDKLLLHRDIEEMKKKIKYLEGKCTEWQFNLKKVEGEYKAIESSVRSTNLTLNKEAKQHRELFCRYNDAQETIHKLSIEIARKNEEYEIVEAQNEILLQEINATKSKLEESTKERNVLLEDLAEKAKRMNDLESDLNNTKSEVNDNVPPSVKIMTNEAQNELAKDLQQRNNQIQELAKKINELENTLNEKKIREESLTKQIRKLQLESTFENEVALKARVTDLEYMVKDLTNEKVELERIVAQKNLELDQRDLLMKKHSEVLQARDKLIPLIQNKQMKHKECTDHLRKVVFEKTYTDQSDDGFYNDDNKVTNNMEVVNVFSINDPSMVQRELSFQQEKMAEVYSLMEWKEMEMMRLERRLRKLQRLHEEKEKMEPEKEENEITEAKQRKASKSRGFLSMFTGKD